MTTLDWWKDPRVKLLIEGVTPARKSLLVEDYDPGGADRVELALGTLWFRVLEVHGASRLVGFDVVHAPSRPPLWVGVEHDGKEWL